MWGKNSEGCCCTHKSSVFFIFLGLLFLAVKFEANSLGSLLKIIVFKYLSKPPRGKDKCFFLVVKIDINI